MTQKPPRHLRLHISPDWFDFHATGRDQVEFLEHIGGLRASDAVLDIACGVGRIALPLRRFLNSEGRYRGFDADPEAIAWCTETIGDKDPRFEFTLALVRTDQFHPEGTAARDYRFEYGDSTFDFCYAGSIFTHLLNQESENYLGEVCRVLKPGGRFVSTWLTYSDDSVASIPGMSGRINALWPRDQNGWRFGNEHTPGESVAYEQGRIRDLYRKAGLRIVEPFRPDASYNLARIPKVRAMGIHLHHCVSVVAIANSSGLTT